VEQVVEDHWQTVSTTRSHRDAVRRYVTEHIDILIPERDRRIRTAERLVVRLKDERDALLRAHYAGAVPLEQLRDEQARIAAALAGAEREVTSTRLARNQLAESLDRALSLLEDAQAHYKHSNGPERRQMNQAVFRRLFIYDDQITEAERTDLYQRLLAPDLHDQLRTERNGTSAEEANTPSPAGHKGKRKNLRPEPQVVGSNFPTLVAGRVVKPARGTPPPLCVTRPSSPPRSKNDAGRTPGGKSINIPDRAADTVDGCGCNKHEGVMVNAVFPVIIPGRTGHEGTR
jgi:site-specific DNA recombinase